MLRMPKGHTTWVPFGHVESNEGVFRSWGGHPGPQFTTYSLALSWTCADSLAMLMSKADHMLMNMVDCGRARAALALNPLIQARSGTPTFLLQGSQVIFVRGTAVGRRYLVLSKA